MRKFSFQLSTPVSRRPWGLLMTYHPTINHLQLLAFSRSARLIGCCHLVWNAGLWVLGRSLSSAVFNWWLIRLKGSLFLISKLGSWLSKIRRYYKDNMKNGWVRPFIRRGLFPRFSWTRMTLLKSRWLGQMYVLSFFKRHFNHRHFYDNLSGMIEINQLRLPCLSDIHTLHHLCLNQLRVSSTASRKQILSPVVKHFNIRLEKADRNSWEVGGKLHQVQQSKSSLQPSKQFSKILVEEGFIAVRWVAKQI